MGPLLLAGRVAAQTVPMPALPPEPAPEAEAVPSSPEPPPGTRPRADAAARLAAAQPRPWVYALGVGAGWDSNIDFLLPDGPSGTALSPRGGFAREFSGPQGRLRAAATGRWTGYFDQSELNRYYADFDLDGAYRSSPGTEWRANAEYGFGYSDSSRILAEQGVLLSLVKTRSLVVALSLIEKLGSKTSLRVETRYYRTDFESPGLIPGESARGTLGLERRLSHQSTMAFQYSLEDVRSDQRDRSYLTHFGSLQWTRVLSLRSALLLEAGASYTPEAVRAALDRKASFYGGASYSRQVKRSSITLFVRHEVAPAFGTGVSRLDLRAGLGATIPMGRAWELRMTANHVRPQAPRAAPLVYDASDAFVGLGRRLGRHLEMSAEGRYRRRGATGSLPVVEAFRAGVFLTLLSPSGEALVATLGR